MSARVVSREPQALAIADFLNAVVAGPAALVMEGELGIGKTTLWLKAVERARAEDFHVMAARPVAAESVLAYASLSDMLDGVDPAVLAELPRAQRVALDRVLRRADAGSVLPTSGQWQRDSCRSSPPWRKDQKSLSQWTIFNGWTPPADSSSRS
jgi:hypothetical protein